MTTFLSQNGTKFPESERTKVVITPTEVIFTNKCAEKDDEGEYAVVLLNALGQDNCSLKVNVKSKCYAVFYFSTDVFGKIISRIQFLNQL